MTMLLASVRSAEEALIACAGGADVIDLKEPSAGALGRLPDATIRAVLDAVAGQRPTSATIGDLALEPRAVLSAVRAMAATGVDIVKLGIFAGDAPATLAALAEPARDGVRLVAVLFADRHPDLALVARCAEAGFFGVMLDTADKSAGPLTRHMPPAELARFVAEARRRRLLAGLAGSLSLADLPALLPLAPDYLGFRSALAVGGRSGTLDPTAMARLRLALDQAPFLSSATATAGAQSAAHAAMAALRAPISSSNPR
jgi:(5-formylfuran-3-yl)methyl phosphate synthase